MEVWLFLIFCALVVIACRLPKPQTFRQSRSDEARRQRQRHRVASHLPHLRGKDVRVVFSYGVGDAAVEIVSSTAIEGRLIDCDDEWALIAGRAFGRGSARRAVRISHILDIEEVRSSEG